MTEDLDGTIAFVASLTGNMRAHGCEIPTTAAISLTRALTVLAPAGVADLYWAGRATLVTRPEDVSAYDTAFLATLAGTTSTPSDAPSEGATPTIVAEGIADLGLTVNGAAVPSVAHADRAGMDDDGPAKTADGDRLSWSAHDITRSIDLSKVDATELDRLLMAIAVPRPTRRSRRHAATPRRRGRIDLRPTASGAVRHGGEVLRLVRRTRRVKPRRVVLLVDVSGSMQPYALAFLRLAHRYRTGPSGVEVFSLGTRLTRLTRALDHRSADVALADAARRIPDWSGGTRLGSALGEFNREWGRAGLARGATVAILSDGWDCGDPEVMALEMGRLHQVAHRIVWINPLKATEGFAPLAGGMAAALPYIDDFVAGNTIDSLEEAVASIAR